MKENLRKRLLSAQKKNILVAGDIILDRFIWGHVSRISPEAPVQIVNVKRENISLGGAANVAQNIVAIGCDVTMMGMTGKDAAGDLLAQEFRRLGISAESVIEVQSRPTITKTRVIAEQQQIVRIDHEQTDEISSQHEDFFIHYIKQHIKQFDAVVISDYQKGLLTVRLLRAIIDTANENGIMTIVDPKRADLSAYSGATLVKPNRKEAEQSLQRSIAGHDAALQAAEEIRQRFAFRSVLITRGREGMTLVSESTRLHISATAREVFDVTGAGDTVTAYLALMLSNRYPLIESAMIANMAAGVAVSKLGTVTVKREEVFHEMEQQTSGSSKIVTAGELSLLLEAFRKKKKIVFTNGCFDILHVGHITLLAKSKALGDVLIVGLNSDASVRSIKGEKRPIVSETERAHILSALEAVDYVVLFDEDTPLELIRQIKPDILVKGSDYKPEQVVGKDVVESYGGEVRLVDLVAGFSTTNIVDAILKNHQP